MVRGKQIIISTGVCLILLVSVIGCMAEQITTIPVPIITNASPTIIETPSVPRIPRKATSTIHFVPNPPTRIFTATQTPIIYSWPTPEPTLTMAVIAAQLASSISICPPEKSVDQQVLRLLIEPTGQYGFEYNAWLPMLTESQLLDTINTFGPMTLMDYFDHNRSKYFFNPKFQILDLTGDGNNEIILRWGGTYVFSCINHKYKTILFLDIDGMMRDPEVIDIFDGNRNGIPEFLVFLAVESQGGTAYTVYEWQQDHFNELIRPWDSVERTGGAIGTNPLGSILISDVNSDGFSEIVVDVSIPTWETKIGGIPWRKEWDTYQWDGQYYTLSRQDFSPPEYRFQAVYDGDRFSINKEYNRAMEYYQLAIESDELEWFSSEKLMNLINEEINGFGVRNPTSTILIAFPDPAEYPNLAAYAQYRMMLIKFIQGSSVQAISIYNRIQREYPEGVPGSIYAYLAKIFWDEYQASNDMGQSCIKVISEVGKNQDAVFKYIGVDGYVGMYLPTYTPQDICPFE
jgi:hypothetical protein